MIAPGTPSRTGARQANPGQIQPSTILGISASLKPAPGTHGHSAAFSLVSYVLDALAGARVNVALLDLRSTPPPLFDGRVPSQHNDDYLRYVFTCVDRAGGLFIAVPAYWAGVSGVFKNFVDVLCGPAYDLPDQGTTVFTEKPVALLVVGADEESTRAGAREAPLIMASTGARLVGDPVSVANPRAGLADPSELSRELVLLGGELYDAIHSEDRETC